MIEVWGSCKQEKHDISKDRQKAYMMDFDFNTLTGK